MTKISAGVAFENRKNRCKTSL